MHLIKTLILTFILFLSLVHGQEKSEKSSVVFELAPHSGFMDGSGTFGLDVSMNYSPVNLEFSALQAIGKTADLYPLTVNLILNLSKKGKMIPYGLVGAGTLISVPSNSLGNETVSTLGINFGGGVRFYLSDTFGLKLGVNQYLTNVKNQRDDTEELLIFQEVALGIVIQFK